MIHALMPRYLNCFVSQHIGSGWGGPGCPLLMQEQFIRFSGRGHVVVMGPRLNESCVDVNMP